MQLALILVCFRESYIYFFFNDLRASYDMTFHAFENVCPEIGIEAYACIRCNACENTIVEMGWQGGLRRLFNYCVVRCIESNASRRFNTDFGAYVSAKTYAPKLVLKLLDALDSMHLIHNIIM